MLRQARVIDVKAIWRLVNFYARQGQMLSVPLSAIYTLLRDFSVVELDGNVVGVAALHLLDGELAEIRSLAILDSYQRQGLGRNLVAAKLEEAIELGVKRVLVLTNIPQFFTLFGFKLTEKELLPQKVWLDCIKCPKFPQCDEQALIYELDKNRSYTRLASKDQLPSGGNT